MKEKASLRFHRIKHCGLYRPQARWAEMGSFSSILSNVYSWSNTGSRLIQNTCTYEVSDDFDMPFLQTYLVAMKRCPLHGDYFLAMWNRTHSGGDAVYALVSKAQVDQVSKTKLLQGNLPASSIPGYATYYWLIPELSTMASITFGSPRTGMSALSHWLECFMATESRYPRFDFDDNLIGYIGDDQMLKTGLQPRFARCLHRNPAKRDVIRANRTQIKGIIRRIYLERAQQAHDDTLLKLLDLLGVGKGPQLIHHEVPLTYELNYTPTAEQLEDMMAAYDRGLESGSWEDVGFKFPRGNSFGANEKEWLSKSFSKSKISLELDWVVPGQLLDMTSLQNSIAAVRKDLLKLVPLAPPQTCQHKAS